MLLTLLAAAALAVTATPPTEAEWAAISAGSVVVRPAPELTPPGAYAWVEIEAAPEAIWSTLNDPTVAVAASNAVSSCEATLDEPTSSGRRIGLHYVLEVAWTEVEYHVIRDFRPGDGTMTWTLDGSKTNDLVSSEGSYVLAPGRTPEHTLLSYASNADSGRNIPQWIQNLLTGKALKKYLGHVQMVAEAR
ncbi:MAG: hypothetical protein ACI8PZ_004572 [Myxococcota bacterium]|jgi:hypothetical protein